MPSIANADARKRFTALLTDFSAKSAEIPKNSVSRLQRYRLGLLSGVAGKRFTSGIDTQLLGATRTELVFRQHPKHRLAHHLFWTALQQRPDRNFLQPARCSAVMAINLLIDLVARQLDPLGIDHDHVIARVKKWRVVRLVLAHQKSSQPGLQAPP